MQQRWGSISYSNHLQLDVFLTIVTYVYVYWNLVWLLQKEQNIGKLWSIILTKIDIFPILRLSIEETPENVEGSFCVYDD